MARRFFTVHGFWASIVARTSPGGPLFPNTSANSVNQQLKRVMCNLLYDQGHRVSPHAFRRGSTGDIENSGSTFATILTSGVWSSCGFRFYLGIHAEEAGNISARLTQALDSESDDPDEVDTPSRPGDITKRLRKRMPPPPMAIVENNLPRNRRLRGSMVICPRLIPKPLIPPHRVPVTLGADPCGFATLLVGHRRHSALVP